MDGNLDMNKSLPPTPRAVQTPELHFRDDPEVCHPDGLYPKIVSPTVMEVQNGEGLERNIESLQLQPTTHDRSSKSMVQGKTMPTQRKRRLFLIVLLVVTIAVTIALGAGLGKGLKRNSSASSDSPTRLPFNTSTPLPKSNAKPADWRARSIYQVLTDRFSLSDSSSPPCDTTKRQYCGGTWQGIINRLDYIQGMGATAVWISPVTAQLTETTGEGEAYHGYWQQDLDSLNPHFGTVADLQALSSALHARNMYLMVDVVVNHFGWAGKNVNYKRLRPFNHERFFHPYCPITEEDYKSDQTAVEQCWLGDETVELVDVDTTDPFVVQTFTEWIKLLVTVFAVDGLRIDTVKHVQKSFWPGFNSAAGVYCLGEVFDGDVNYTCPYQDQMDGLLDYPTYYAAINTFRHPNGSMSTLSSTLTAVQNSCRDSTLLGMFSENHDVARFRSLSNDMSLNMNMITFSILGGGIPIVYQGQEQGFSGSDDPANREALWTSGFSTKTSLYTLIASVNQIRNYEIFVYPQYLTSSTSVIYSDDHNIALRKGQIIGLYSNMGSASSYSLTLTGVGESKPFMEILACKNSTADAKGNLRVSIQQGLPQVFYPIDALNKSGICSL
ncbi:MAG: hypothetical protein Q9222_005683 [Ikaeria aurantiellina]